MYYNFGQTRWHELLIKCPAVRNCSKLLKNFDGTTSISPLKVFHLCLEMSSDCKDCFRFAVGEFSEFKRIIKLNVFHTETKLLLTDTASNTPNAQQSTLVHRILRKNSDFESRLSFYRGISLELAFPLKFCAR